MRLKNAGVVFAAAVTIAFAGIPATSARAETLKAFDQGHVHVMVADEPKRVEWSVVVPGSVDDVWNAFTTSAGMRTWIAPAATVELRTGGQWTVAFPNVAPGGGTIIDFEPKSFIGIGAMAPEKFPNVRKERTFALFTFTSQSPKSTLVHLTQTGWRDGAEWDDAMNYLEGGNAQLLELLYRRFALGPIDWTH